ncbi:Cupredoxin, partial [Lactarius hatsudake]
PGNPYPGGGDLNINLVVTPNQEHTRYLVNNVTFKVPDVPVLLQTLSGKHNAADLLPEGSIYPVIGNKSVEVSIAAGAPVGPVSVQSLHHRLEKLEYNVIDPVVHDVMSIGDTGNNFTFWFITSNPGPWFLHCHIGWHLRLGFAVVFAVGVSDVPELDHPPKPFLPEQWAASARNTTVLSAQTGCRSFRLFRRRGCPVVSVSPSVVF